MQGFCESVRRYTTSRMHCVSGMSRRAVQKRLHRPIPSAFQQRPLGKLPIHQQRVSIVDGKGHGPQQLFPSMTHFEMEISKPDDDIDLPKAAALLALHANTKINTVRFVQKELSRLKAGFRAHAEKNVPLAAPLPESCREKALVGALCDFLKADGFEGCSPANYYRAENSLLHSVLSKKRGNPISLALLYHEVGQAGGLCLKGVKFPRHCLLRFGSGDRLGLLDPFSNCVLSRSEVYKLIAHIDPHAANWEPNWDWPAPLPKKVFLKHMASNLQNVYQRDDNTELATRLARYMDLLDEPHLHAYAH